MRSGSSSSPAFRRLERRAADGVLEFSAHFSRAMPRQRHCKQRIIGAFGPCFEKLYTFQSLHIPIFSTFFVSYGPGFNFPLDMLIFKGLFGQLVRSPMRRVACYLALLLTKDCIFNLMYNFAYRFAQRRASTRDVKIDY
ncbi:hypothetical protein BGW80DRAFT_83196 [Lactifluus volemus]|nr:hypothetical protein BGW80DRAFT_83196 [Lactifluus volemus]